MENIPAQYVHGQGGFDERIMRDLARVDVRAYTLDALANGPSTIPQAIPVFTDWLSHLEERIPGPEPDHGHRSIIRSGLIRNLIDPAARGNQQVIELLIGQVQHQPPLPPRQIDWALGGLKLICGPKEFSRIAALIPELPPGAHVSAIIEYLGKVKTPESHQLLIGYLDGPARAFAVKALVQAKAPNVRHLIARLEHDPVLSVRKAARRAMERLPKD
ncbi:HEAT repeat domain-containing protein [Mycobacteroides salmoniphilum]|nr:HEAT repeat domain-containing protein [Mycobacteroides salmoniphilum]